MVLIMVMYLFVNTLDFLSCSVLTVSHCMENRFALSIEASNCGTAERK